MRLAKSIDDTYAHQRRTNEAIGFRLAARAGIVTKAAKKYLAGNSHLRILDLGTADGRTMQEMEKQLPGSRFMGIELSDSLIASATDLTDNIELIKGDVTRLPRDIDDESFDLVSILAVLEHLEDPERALREAKRVLRTGGLCVATSPSPAWDVISSRLGLLKETGHEQRITHSVMVSLVEKAGLDLLEYRRFMWTPVAFLPYLRVPVPPGLALRIDRIVESLRILNWMFVNQAVVAVKP